MYTGGIHKSPKQRAKRKKGAKRFLERLHGKRVIEDVEDMVSWTETKSGKYNKLKN